MKAPARVSDKSAARSAGTPRGRAGAAFRLGRFGLVAGHGAHNTQEEEDLELVRLRCVWKAAVKHNENQVQALVSNPTNFDYNISTGERKLPSLSRGRWAGQ